MSGRIICRLRPLSYPKHALPPKVKKTPLKFILNNKIAYTEDHILVQKLHLFGMPMELTQDALLDYFTQNYGPNVLIERIGDSVSADKEPKSQPTWNAFALFADARNAARVLLSSEHMVCSHKFHVQPSYSWLQPNAVEESNELEFETFPLILKLNDDCLECVFQYLSLVDQIRLARTCTRFRTVYQRLLARKQKSVDDKTTKDLTLWEAREFCQLSGQHVQSLVLTPWANHNFRHCFYAGLHFPNLKDLNIYDNHLKVHKLQRILLGTNNLKELIVKTDRKTDPLELAHLKELKRLVISEWNTEGLILPTSIESLTVHDWIEISCLPSILKDHTKIKKLQVIGTTKLFKEMAGSQAFASVEVLEISAWDFDMKGLIAQLPKLTKLSLLIKYFDWDAFSEIIKGVPHQLDHFQICPRGYIPKENILQITSLIGLHTLELGYTEEIDDEVISAFSKLTELKRFGLGDSYIERSSVLQLLINCPKLSKLKMESHNIHDELLESIISLLRKDIQSGKNQREWPVQIYLKNFGRRYIRRTDPEVVDVVVKSSSTWEWFDEELKVKN